MEEENKYKAQAAYYERNKEKIQERNREAAKKYYHNHKEEAAERAKKWRTSNKEYILTKQRETKRQRKLDAIEYLGGRCSGCLEEYHPSVYEFHHIDPLTKDRDPSKMLSLSPVRLKAELDKCRLLCANCHRLIHHEGNY